MANDNISAAVAAEKAEGDGPKMFKVKLKSVVSLYGFLFKPGQDITVNEDTLKAMGDAVDHAEQV